MKTLMASIAILCFACVFVKASQPVTFGTAISQGYLQPGEEFTLFQKTGTGYISYMWWTEAQADTITAGTILNYYVDVNPPLTVTLDMLAGIGWNDSTAPWVQDRN